MNGPVRDPYRNWRWWATLLVVSVMTMTTLMYIVGGGVEEGAYIEVEDVFFIMTEQDNETTTMDIDVFITNHGEEDLSDVTVRAFAVEEDSNLARDEAVVRLGALGGQKTIEGNLTITIPNGESYRVELLVFKEGKLSIRGAGEVNLRTSVEYLDIDGISYSMWVPRTTNYTTNEPDSPPVKSGGSDEAFSADAGDSSSYILVVGVGVIIVLIVLIVKGTIGNVEGRPPRERMPPGPERIPPPRVMRDWEMDRYDHPGPYGGRPREEPPDDLEYGKR